MSTIAAQDEQDDKTITQTQSVIFKPPTLDVEGPQTTGYMKTIPRSILVDHARSDAEKAISTMRGLSALQRALDDMTQDVSTLTLDPAVATSEDIYNQVMTEYPCSIGKALSKKERDESGRHQSSLVYGEISFKSFGMILNKIKTIYGRPEAGVSGLTGPKGVMQEPGGTFVDIGSGTGKPVFAAVAFHPFTKAIGIEILTGLHNQAIEILKRWDEVAKPLLIEHHQAESEIELIQGDFTDLSLKDWTDGDVCFANSTCFDDKLMNRIAALANGLKEGSFFITLTKRLPSALFKVLENDMYSFSWGGATVYVQQKVTDPEPSSIITSSSLLLPPAAAATPASSSATSIPKSTSTLPASGPTSLPPIITTTPPSS